MASKGEEDVIDDKNGKEVPETFFWEFAPDDQPDISTRASDFFASFTYFVLAYFKSLSTSITSNWTNILNQPFRSIFSLLLFAVTILFLAGFAIVLGIADFFNFGAVLDYISNTFYRGNSFCNWGSPDLLHDHQADFIAGIRDIIDGREVHILDNKHNKANSPPRLPNVDNFSIPAAKSSLLLAAVAYEGWDNFTKFIPPLNTPDLYVSQARELHARDVVSFTRIIFIRDNVTNQNLIYVIFRGTSPFAVAEWLTDSSMSKVPADRFIWGNCHEGFYSKLFLPLRPNFRSIYRNILDSIQEMILKDVEVDGKIHPYFLLSTGHSLGAAYSQFFHARLLKSPEDINFTLQSSGIPSFQPPIKFVGSYTFGSPRGGNFQHYRSFTGASRHPLDRNVNLWRVVDANDFIPSVVPGIDDPNTAAITASNNPQDLLDFTHFGRLVHIHRFRHEAVAPLPSRVGTWPSLFFWLTSDYHDTIDYLRDLFSSWLTAFRNPDPVNIAGSLFPFMGDHAPAKYYVNLDNAIEPKITASSEEIGI